MTTTLIVEMSLVAIFFMGIIIYSAFFDNPDE